MIEATKKPQRSKMTSIYTMTCEKCSKQFKTTNPDATLCQKCADRAAAKPTTESGAKTDEPHIECRLLVGDLSLPIDASSLSHTLGVADYGYGKGLVDSWPDTAWAGLLTYLKLPADPLDRSAAESPVKRLVQRLWYEAIQGGVPVEQKAVLEERDAERADAYKAEFTGVKAAVIARKERSAASFGRSGETTYNPLAALKAEKLKMNGQAGILLEAFRAGNFEPMTTVQAADNMVKAGLKTTTKPERIAAFYLCQFVKKSLLERGVRSN